jgi:TMEM175 potassium channel family protein
VSESNSPERMVFFGDAAVAIALTVLVLPLTEAVPEAIHEHRSAIDLVGDLQGEIYTFLLSFVVIAQFWVAHHRIFGHVTAYTGALLRLHLAWVLTIVVLPFPTAMTAGFGEDRFAPLLYIGTVLASSVCLLGINTYIQRHPEVRDEEPSRRQLDNGYLTSASLVIAFGLAFIPGVGYYALFMLFVPPIILRLRYRATP